MSVVEGIQGLDQLVRTIRRLKDRTAKRAAISGLNAGLTALNRAIRPAINASGASPQMKAAARQTLGKRLVKESYTRAVISAKAGFGVGLHGKLKRARAAGRVAARKAKHGDKGGVGITASNIHWPVLGTKDRKTGTRTTRSKGRTYSKSTGNPVHSTGKMPAVLHGLIAAAVASSGSAIMDAVRRKVQQVIEGEVHASHVPKLVR